MCGQHWESPQSITHNVDLIKRGKTTVGKAVNKLTRPCVCGIITTSRIIEILTALVKA